MDHLFIKASRLGSSRKVIAWSKLGTGCHGGRNWQMSAAERGEFEFCISHGKASTVGAGGQFEYRVYERIGEVNYPYAVVRPTIEAVRAQYPSACRVVNLETGMESALCDTLEHALDIVHKGKRKELKGAFQ